MFILTLVILYVVFVIGINKNNNEYTYTETTSDASSCSITVGENLTTKSKFKIILHKAKNGQYYATANYTSNGNVFMTTETYKNWRFLLKKLNELSILLNCTIEEK